MTATHLLALWQAETNKLLSRLPARITLLVSVAVGLFASFLLGWLGGSEMTFNGTPLSESLTKTAPMALQWSLELRNFFIFRVLLIMLGALSFAGEFQARTLREDLVRPFPRWALLLAKWGALVTVVALCAGLTWLVASVMGLVMFGVRGDWGAVALGYLATIAADAGFAALILAISVALRSVAGTIVGVVLFLLFDTVLGWALTLLSWVGQLAELPWALTVAVQAKPWLPSAAFGVWTGFKANTDWSWQSGLALVGITVVSLLVAERLFARADVP